MDGTEGAAEAVAYECALSPVGTLATTPVTSARESTEETDEMGPAVEDAMEGTVWEEVEPRVRVNSPSSLALLLVPPTARKKGRVKG